jgi:hypothetical protein
MCFHGVRLWKKTAVFVGKTPTKVDLTTEPGRCWFLESDQPGSGAIVQPMVQEVAEKVRRRRGRRPRGLKPELIFSA